MSFMNLVSFWIGLLTCAPQGIVVEMCLAYREHFPLLYLGLFIGVDDIKVLVLQVT
jgi:hypothetical protein